jgi:hypothetical protein
MKNKNIKIALVAVGLAGMVSCNKIKDFGTTNVNPNDISSPITSAVLTSAESGIDVYARDLSASTWIQHTSETQYPSEGLYDVTASYHSFGAYTGVLLNLRTVITKSAVADEIAAARVLTQYVYWQLTDNLGDIPYSQAFNSKTPAYDKQEDIYKGMITELKAAKAQFINSGELKGDILNGNNVTTWIKFANSLRAMMALQLSKKYPGATDYAATEFKLAIADGVIEAAANNVKLSYPGGANKNPFWSNFDGARDNGESTTIYSLLNGLSDGRQAAVGTSTVAVPFGLKEASINAFIKANPTWSHMFGPVASPTGSPLRLDNSPVYILKASQLFLARAEAAVRGWTSENKNTMMVAGVNASFGEMAVALPPASYFTQPALVLDGGANDLKKVCEQEWIAAFPDGKAAWNLYRRTGFPVLTPAPDPLNAAHTSIPRRYTYSPTGATSEYSLNPVQVAAAVAKLSPATDQPESKIWWDQ